MSRPLLLLGLLCATGCAFNRVAIGNVPEATAPLQERVKAYKKLSIQSGQTTTYLKNGVPQGNALNFVLLGDGTRVEDPRDLSPAIEPTSATARYIGAVEERIEAGKRWTKIFGFGGAGALALGLGVGLPLALNQSCTRMSCGPDPATNIPGILVASVIGGLGYFALLVGLPFAMGMSTGDGSDRVSAFMTYNDSLKERLRLDDEALEKELPPQKTPPPSARLQPDLVRMVTVLASMARE